MRFGVVELSLGMVVRTGRNFVRMRDEIENTEPSRWDNPILIVIPADFDSTHEEGEVGVLEPLENRVVAVPFSG